jgi:hypothetical protein
MGLLQDDDEESEESPEDEPLEEECDKDVIVKKESMKQNWGKASRRRLGKRRGSHKHGRHRGKMAVTSVLAEEADMREGYSWRLKQNF